MQLDRSRVIRDFGQLFFFGVDGLSIPEDCAEFMRRFRIGGLILFEDNFHDPDQLREFTAELQRRCAEPDAPLTLGTDHEGGRIQSFRSGFSELPCAADLGAGPPAETERVYGAAGRELRAAGLHANFAPVADLCERDAPGSIGDRSFGSDAETVGRHVAAAVRGLQAAGIAAGPKHFPGHGATIQDSHRELPVVTGDQARIEQVALAPFRAAIDSDAAFVMTAHAVLPESDEPHVPVTLSDFWLREVLRRRLGFEGLAITDALEMKALRGHWTPQACGRQAIVAGADVLLYYREAYQYDAFSALRRALIRDELPWIEIARSQERVRRFKQNFVSPQTEFTH